MYWINVPIQINEYDKSVPGIIHNIQKCNNSIKKIIGENTIDIASFSLNEVMSDFHHLNCEGHSKLADKIEERLRLNHVI